MTKPEINVTPLIDVLLVLLIIFMVVTPARPGKFEAKIPSEPKNEIADLNPTTLVISIDAPAAITLNTEKIDATAASPAGLVNRLKEVFAAREVNMETQRTVFI